MLTRNQQAFGASCLLNLIFPGMLNNHRYNHSETTATFNGKAFGTFTGGKQKGK